MAPSLRYEILEHLPPYGPMYVPVSTDGYPFYSEGVAIRFFKSDGKEWVANFKPGSTKLKTVVELAKSPKLLVIAKGICYLINPEFTAPEENFGMDYSAIFPFNKERFILQSSAALTIVEPDGSHWDSEIISMDSLKDLTVEGHIVKGLSLDLNPEEWVPFTYDIEKKELTGGSYTRYSFRPERGSLMAIGILLVGLLLMFILFRNC